LVGSVMDFVESAHIIEDNWCPTRSMPGSLSVNDGDLALSNGN